MFRRVAILVVLLFSVLNTAVFAAPLAQGEEEGNPWWLWLIVFAVIGLFVAFMLWWWLREPEEAEETTETGHRQAGVYDTPDMPEAAADDGQIVAAYTAPGDTEVIGATKEAVDIETAELETTEPDDLTIVEGIGPAIQKVLYAAGINTYRDLAATDPDRLEAILHQADAKLARLFDPTTWPEQSQLAAEGKWEELKALTDRLNAGRRG